MWRVRFAQIVFCSVSAIALNSASALAQTIPDSSLGQENSVVTPGAIDNNLVDLIEGGAIRANNLFHSFSKFNVGDGEGVYFANPDGIENIFSRVTGNNISEILGTLGVNGAANLWLLNPKGIVFGENAALDINGSFFATTAESFIFGEAEFTAVEPTTAPLLKINFTPGLQMSDRSGSITVEGKGHELVGGTFSPIQNNSLAPGLQAGEKQALSLIAGEIELDGAIIKTVGGKLELASVKQGNIYLDLNSKSDRLNISEVEEFGDLKLLNKALLDASGVFTGDINLTAANITFEDASAAIIQNWGDDASGKITLNATSLVELTGSRRNAPDTPTSFGIITGIAYSRLTTETLGLGSAGDIAIDSQNLSLDDGGHIASRTFSNANTGNINIDVDELIEVNSYSQLSPSFFASIISTSTFGFGDAEKINISAQNMNILDGGTISSINFGKGDNKAGKVNIDAAEDLTIDGINPFTLGPSSIASATFTQGDSGSVTVNTARLSIANRGLIGTSTLAEGSAGQLAVNATKYIQITNPNVDDPKFAFSNSGIGSGGRIIDPVLRQFTGAPDVPSGDSGNLFLNTPTLIVSDGAEIAVSNQGFGDSGNLQINAERVFLNNKGNITAFSATGEGGNIELNLQDSLLLSDNSSITAENTGTFSDRQMDVNGGNISISADTVTLLKGSQINADAFEGDGGNINITTQGLFVESDSSIAASSEFGLDGNVEVEIINQEGYLELEQLPGNLTDVSQKITQTCSAKDSKFAIAGKGGLPENPGQSLRGEVLWQDLRLPVIQSNLTAEEISPESLSNLIYPVVKEANNWQITPKGKVKLLTSAWQKNYSAKAFNCGNFATR